MNIKSIKNAMQGVREALGLLDEANEIIEDLKNHELTQRIVGATKNKFDAESKNLSEVLDAEYEILEEDEDGKSK